MRIEESGSESGSVRLVRGGLAGLARRGRGRRYEADVERVVALW